MANVQPQSHFHLTQYSEDSMYVQAQIEDLAVKMNMALSIPDTVKVGDPCIVKNDIASFVFTCTEVDERPDCSANYYKLVKIIKHIQAEVGAKIIVACNFQDAFRQGDIATLTKDEGPSGWWATFPTGRWNVGSGYDFFVIKAARKRRASAAA